MPKPKTETEYVSNNSFMTSQLKAPKPFGSDYEDPLEVLKAEHQKGRKMGSVPEPTIPSSGSDKKTSEIASLDKVTTSSSTRPTIPSKNLEPTSPVRDFQKVSNSITRKAIPSGIFGSGKAKQLYDALYSLTRGAIKPIRVIRITKPRLMKLAGISTRQTLWLNLEHLETVGLVRKRVLLGEHGGNEYEVFVPEELPGLETIPTIPTTPTKRVYQVQKLVGVVGIDSIPTTPSSQPINTGVSDTPNTSFKDYTKNDDDNARTRDGFSVMIERLNTATKKLTGKNVTKRETEAWGTLADLLVLELEVAASRSDGVSSVPAFLTEILRRQFFASRQQQNVFSKTLKVKKDTVGKSDSDSYEIKPLDQKGREEALAQLREFAEDDFLPDFKKWYTAEDWDWLMKQFGNN